MAMETNVILRSIYGILLKAVTLEEARNHVKMMMGAEEAAYVEKMVSEEQKKTIQAVTRLKRHG